MRVNMFRATRRPSSGAPNCTSSLWFCIRERLLDVEVVGRCQVIPDSVQQPLTYAKSESASAVWRSWWGWGCWTLSGMTWQRPTTSTSNNISRMQNQRLLVQFGAPDDGVVGRCQVIPDSVQQPQRPTTSHVWKSEAASAVWSSWWRLRLLDAVRSYLTASNNLPRMQN